MMELRVVLRRLRASPGFVVVSVLTLALGIGVTVAIFSLVHGVLLKQLPYPEAERLVVVSHTAPALHLDDMDISVPLYLRYRERASSFEEITLIREGHTSLTGLDVPTRLQQGTVTSSIFRVFRVSPLLGRPFAGDDEKQGAPAVALLSERLWRGRFGADPLIVGRKIEVDGTTREIVGVMPLDFEVPDPETDLWLPLTINREVDRLGSFGGRAIGRLKKGVTVSTALADLKRMTDGIIEQFPEERAAPVLARSGFKPLVVPLLEHMVGDVERALWVVLGAVAFVLLMACANVANLFLVRAESRQREIALRSALGATRRSIVLSFLVEGSILALAGGGLGVVLANGAIRALVRLAPEGVPRLQHVGLDGPVLLFALGASVLSSLLFCILPSLPQRTDVAASLRDGGRGTSEGRPRVRARQILVVVQVALGFVLLICATLMVRSYRALQQVRPGFDESHALTLRLSLPSARYGSPALVAGFVDRLTERLASLPGASVAGAVSNLPLTGSASAQGHALEDFPLGDDDIPPVFIYNFVSAGYLKAMGIPLVEGRGLEPADHLHKTGVAVVSQSIARRYWPGGSPIGKRIRPGRADEQKWYTIVGVAGDVRQTGLQEEPAELVYYPMVGYDGDSGLGTNMSLVLRTRSAPESLGEAARAAVWEVDPNVPITHVLTLEQMVEAARAPTAFNMLLMLLASALALLLGGIGIYGVISFVVTQRTHEIGVRMALGALRRQVRVMVLRDGLSVALAGVGVGLVFAIAVTRLMKSLLFGVSPLDPLTFAAVPVFLLAVAIASSVLPAERASRVDPAVALRKE